MADQIFPQIPSTVWWGMRQLLQKSPKAKYDESMLAASLSVQPAAAKQYLAELKRVGILDEDGRGTELANRWRMDETYSAAVEQLASAVYPEALVTIAPPGEADRQKAVNWFMSQGLGEGSAKNKAATYILLTSNNPGTTPTPNGKTEAPKASTEKKPKKAERAAPASGSASGKASEITGNGVDMMPLNVNVQIHISADAGKDQIEAIFSAMRKYLKND